MNEYGEIEEKWFLVVNPLFPETWTEVQEERTIYYTVIGSNDDPGILHDAWMMGHYLGKAGFTLQTMGYTELEKQFARGCKSVDGRMCHYPPDGQSAKLIAQSGGLDSGIRSIHVPAREWDAADIFTKQWYIAAYLLLTSTIPDFCFMEVEDDVYGRMVDMNSTYLFPLNPDMNNRLVSAITGMDQL